MAKSKNKNGSSSETTGRPAPLVNNWMETKLPSPASRNSLFSGEKTREYFFFLPGSAELYITKKIKTDENERMISTWPIDDLASQTESHVKESAKAFFSDVNPNSKGIPAGNFFKAEQDAYNAAIKTYPRIPVCIIKLVAPTKLLGKITDIPDKKQKQIFPFELMPLVEAITEFSQKNRFSIGTVYKKQGQGNKLTFERLDEPQTSLTPRKK